MAGPGSGNVQPQGGAGRQEILETPRHGFAPRRFPRTIRRWRTRHTTTWTSCAAGCARSTTPASPWRRSSAMLRASVTRRSRRSRSSGPGTPAGVAPGARYRHRRWVAVRGRPECRDPACARIGRPGGPHQRHGAADRRNRDRQGALRHVRSTRQPPPRRRPVVHVNCGPCRPRSSRVSCSGAKRASTPAPCPADRAVRARRRRDAVPRRGRRDPARECRPSCSGCSRRVRSNVGQHAASKSTCGSSPRPTGTCARRSSRRVPAGPVLPAERLSDRGAAAARARRGHPAAGRGHPRAIARRCGSSVRRAQH